MFCLPIGKGRTEFSGLPVSKAEHTLVSVGLSISATNWMVVPWTHVLILGAVRLGKTGTKEGKVTPFETGFCSASEEAWHAPKKDVQQELA